MLGDAAGLARHDVGLAQRVEQRGLAVSTWPMTGDDRGTRHQMARVVLAALQAFEHVGFRRRASRYGRIRRRPVRRCRRPITSLAVAIWPFFIRTLMMSTERRALRLASSATVMVSGITTSRGPAGTGGRRLHALHPLQMAAIRSDRAHALVVARQGLVTVSLPRRRLSSPIFLAGTGLAGTLVPFLVVASSSSLPADGARARHRPAWRRRPGPWRQQHRQRPACLPIWVRGARLPRRRACAPVPRRPCARLPRPCASRRRCARSSAFVFGGAQARVFLGPLAGFFLIDAGIGQGRAAAGLFLFRELAQHDAARRRGRGRCRRRAWRGRGLPGGARPAPSRPAGWDPACASSPPRPPWCGHG